MPDAPSSFQAPDASTQALMGQALKAFDAMALGALFERWGPLDRAWRRLHPGKLSEPLTHRALSLWDATAPLDRSLLRTARAAFLLKAPTCGVELDAFNDQGQTALHRAVERRDVAWALDLLAAGADPDVRTRSGETAIASMHGDDWSSEAIALRLGLVQAGASLAATACAERSPPLLIGWIDGAPNVLAIVTLFRAASQPQHRAAWVERHARWDHESAASFLRKTHAMAPLWSEWALSWLATLDEQTLSAAVLPARAAAADRPTRL